MNRCRIERLVHELIRLAGRAEVAAALDIDESTLSRYLSNDVGIKLCRLEALFDLADRFGLHVEQDIGAEVAKEIVWLAGQGLQAVKERLAGLPTGHLEDAA